MGHWRIFETYRPDLLRSCSLACHGINNPQAPAIEQWSTMSCLPCCDELCPLKPWAKINSSFKLLLNIHHLGCNKPSINAHCLQMNMYFHCLIISGPRSQDLDLLVDLNYPEASSWMSGWLITNRCGRWFSASSEDKNGYVMWSHTRKNFNSLTFSQKWRPPCV